MCTHDGANVTTWSVQVEKMAAGVDGSVQKQFQNDLDMEAYEYPYRGIVPYIAQHTKITKKAFKNMELSDNYLLDLSRCRVDRRLNRSSVFEYFAELSCEHPDNVRAGMITRMRLDTPYYERCGHIIAGFKQLSFGEWLEHMADPNVPADELAIFALSKIYDLHTMIYTTGPPWSTLKPPSPISVQKLHRLCQVHFVYTSKDMYAELLAKTPQYVDTDFESEDQCDETYPSDVGANLEVSDDQQHDALDLSLNKTVESGEREQAPEQTRETHVSTPSYDHERETQTQDPSPSIADSLELVEPPAQATPMVTSTTLTGELYQALFGDTPVEETLANLTADDNNTSDEKSLLGKKEMVLKLNRMTNAELEKYLGNKDADNVKESNTGESPPIEDVDSVKESNTGSSPPIEDNKQKSSQSLETVNSTGESDQQSSPKRGRPLRRTRKPVRYSEVQSSPEGPPPPKRGKAGPSQARIDAQKQITDSNNSPKTASTAPTSPRKNSSSSSRSRSSSRTRSLSTNSSVSSTVSGRQSTGTSVIRTSSRSSSSSSSRSGDSSSTIRSSSSGSSRTHSVSTTSTEPITTKQPKKGKLSTRTVGIKKRIRKRKFKCDLCEYRGKKLKNLNKHYKNKHEKLNCPVCNKEFNTPASLKRHSYSHKNLKFICNNCQKGFAFESELTVHKAIHRTIPTFPCMASKCTFKFKTQGELVKHVKVHSGVLWKCKYKDCTYSNPDRRNLIAHVKSHTQKKTHYCIRCGEGFVHSMQLKRHKVRNTCTPQSL